VSQRHDEEPKVYLFEKSLALMKHINGHAPPPKQEQMNL